MLKNIFPNADIKGIDSSENMIKTAFETYPELEFELCDARKINGRYDLIFSNACLQWLPNHNTLIPQLMSKLNSNGTLAVQMPANNEEPLYKAVIDTAKMPKWGFDENIFNSNITLAPRRIF
ncbi:MAG: methyltransferase domain-containing protein [Clostridiales bacterium]|nr:methyltransferase domain-containing protein [Clostridiales bacterium]